MSYGSLWQRWDRGVSWTWVNDRYRSWLPKDLDTRVMTLESHDRFHAKQGRTTARVVFHRGDDSGRAPQAAISGRSASGPSGSGESLAVYLKRHLRLPWTVRLAALVNPAGKHSPAAAEFAHLARARALGIAVPDVVAAGERIGPHSHLSSFLMVAELTGSTAINELLEDWSQRLDARAFANMKRRAVTVIAGITATLHTACVFHKDLYLCHFFLETAWIHQPDGPPPVALIDLHRLGEHRSLANWWRWKDLGQLLYSTYGVPGITDRDRLRFWARYRRLTGMSWPRWHECAIRLRAARYLAHNRKQR